MAIIPSPSTPTPEQRRPLQKGPESISIAEQLIPCSWRDVQFPLASIRVSISQDLTEHKYWGVDVGNVEATGRNPMQIEAEIPLVNGIVPGKNESWGTLYPDVFRKLQDAFGDRTTGTLVHPELGEIPCKPVSFEYQHDPQRRDGVFVTARWVETLTENFDGALGAIASPIQTAQLAALDLDSSDEDIRDKAPAMPVFEETWDSAINKVVGAIDKISTTASLAANKPAQVLHRLETVGDAIDRARNVTLWPARDAVERMKGAMFDIASSVTKGRRQVLRFTTTARVSLSVLAGQFTNNTTDDLIRLNPQLLANPDVPANTLVRYYAP